MRQRFNGKSRVFGIVSLALMSGASLTGCATWLAGLQEERQVKADLTAKVSSGVKLPDMPAELRTCLLKQACQEEASKAKASSQPAPQCTTADGILLAYVQSEREKRACSLSMMKWYREQQRIQESASGLVKDGGHPRSGKAAKTASWP